jgi:hypothetical protein
MKKVTLVLMILLSYISLYSQDSIPKTFYGIIYEYRYCTVEKNKISKWSEWTEVDNNNNIIVYFDWNFGFFGVTNSQYSRYMFLKQESDEYIDNNRIFKIRSVDESYVICNTDISFKKDKTIQIRIEYSNMMIEYKLKNIKHGYPHEFFKMLQFKNDSINNLKQKNILDNNLC